MKEHGLRATYRKFVQKQSTQKKTGIRHNLGILYTRKKKKNKCKSKVSKNYSSWREVNLDQSIAMLTKNKLYKKTDSTK